MKLAVDTDELLKKLNDSIGATMGEQIPRWLWEGIVAELKNERPQGEWITHQIGMMLWKECNQCYAQVGTVGMNFCPNCGTDMRGAK